MKTRIAAWEPGLKVVCIGEDKLNVVAVTKTTDEVARVEIPTVWLDAAETKDMARILELAAKVAGYLDELMPSDAYDMIARLPTTPYDGFRPMPRAGRTKNP